MGQFGTSGEVSIEDLEINSSTTTSSENIFLTPQNSQDQFAEIQQKLASAGSKFQIEEIQDLEMFKSALNSNSNFPTFLNNELKTQDLVGFKWTLGTKEETPVLKTLEDGFEGVKISEISSKNATATNTNITQDQFLTEKTIPTSESQKDSVYPCLSFKDLMEFLSTEIIENIPFNKDDKLNSDASSVEKRRNPRSKKRSTSKQKTQNSSNYLHSPFKKEASEKITLKCMSRTDKQIQKKIQVNMK